MKALIAGCLLAMVSVGAAAEERSMNLFKVVSTREEVTVGFAQETTAEKLAAKLVKDGYVNGWQYATSRGEKGELVMKPQREVALMAAQVVRIEAVEPGQQVVPPPAR